MKTIMHIKSTAFLSVVGMLIVFTVCCNKRSSVRDVVFTNNVVWRDTDGNQINAHGGGIMFHEDTYYWYGEIKGDSTYRNFSPAVANWECYRTEAGGISCYSSRDMQNWTFEGVSLETSDDPGSDLHPSKVLERPKVIYNDMTGKYVMWLHVDSDDYTKACAGVAVSDTPQGPFLYLGSSRPVDNQASRDMTLFKDEDGTAYLIFSSEENATMYIAPLSPDYIKPAGPYTRNFVNQYREAPAVFKRGGNYYMISSGCTGWDPNEAEYAIADSMMGTWRVMGNPCRGDDADKTFFAQSTYVLPVVGKEDSYIAMLDRWNKLELIDSRYIWLPIIFERETITIPWFERWNTSVL